MIYVLFGPPGVGKTYLGQLLGRELDIPFLDADTLYDAEEMRLLQEGIYDQSDRDKFIEKLIKKVDALVVDGEQDLILAEAFTKEKNRLDFISHFGKRVRYVLIETPREIAMQRAKQRLRESTHIINDVAFDLIWDEFERPIFTHLNFDNVSVDDRELVLRFSNLIQSLLKEDTGRIN